MYSNSPILSQVTLESNIEQFYKNEKYEKISYESRNMSFFIVISLAVWSQWSAKIKERSGTSFQVCCVNLWPNAISRGLKMHRAHAD